ncbi:DUF1415 family protein [Alginatibacterium sediminis]
MNTLNSKAVRLATQNWVDTFVVGMNLCPFAKREVVNNRLALRS